MQLGVMLLGSFHSAAIAVALVAPLLPASVEQPTAVAHQSAVVQPVADVPSADQPCHRFSFSAGLLMLQLLLQFSPSHRC